MTREATPRRRNHPRRHDFATAPGRSSHSETGSLHFLDRLRRPGDLDISRASSSEEEQQQLARKAMTCAAGSPRPACPAEEEKQEPARKAMDLRDGMPATGMHHLIRSSPDELEPAPS